jgi:hypothetical protein
MPPGRLLAVICTCLLCLLVPGSHSALSVFGCSLQVDVNGFRLFAWCCRVSFLRLVSGFGCQSFVVYFVVCWFLGCTR